MNKSKINNIRFQILYILNQGQEMVMQFQNCEQMRDILIPMRLAHQEHDDVHEVRLEFSSSPDFKPQDEISYKYLIVHKDNPEQKIRDVIDESTRQPMVLTFKRQDYLDKYVEIFDRCDHQIMNSRKITKMKYDQVINQTIRILETLPEGRAFFLIVLNDLNGVNPKSIDENKDRKSNDEKNVFFRAQMFDKVKLGVDKQLWLHNIVFRFDDLRKSAIKRPFLAAIFESFCYDRTIKKWRVSPMSQKRANPEQLGELKEYDDIKDLAKDLDEADIKYQVIQSNSQKEEDVVISRNGEQGDFPTDIWFVYQASQKDIPDSNVIFTVFLVIKDKGNYKMTCKQNTKRRIWQVKVPLYPQQHSRLDYFFDVNTIGKVDQNGERRQDNRKKLQTQPEVFEPAHVHYDRNFYISSSSPVVNTTTYSTNIYYGDSYAYATPSVIRSNRYYIDGREVDYWTYYYHNFNWSRPIRSTVNYYTSYIPRSVHQRTRTTFSHVTNYQKKNHKTSLLRQVMNQNPTGQKRTAIRKPTLISDDTPISAAPKAIVNNIYRNNIIKNVIEQPSATKIIETINNYQTIIQEVDYLNSKYQQLFELNLNDPKVKEKVNKIVFLKEYGPVKLLLEQVTKKQRVKDDFKKLIDNLTPMAKSLQQKIDEIHRLQNSKEEISDSMVTNDIQILSIRMICEVKLWGKTGYTRTNMVNILQGHLPQVSEESQIRIANILYYLNDYTHIKKSYTRKVAHGMSGVCQDIFQGKIQNAISQIRQGKQRPFSFVQNDKLYQLFVLLVDTDIDGFAKFAFENKLTLHTSEVSTNLMRVLMNYAIIYCLGRYYDARMPIFDNSFCGQFQPFCFETGQYYISHHLNLIRDRYEAANQNHRTVQQSNEEKLKRLKSELVNTLQEQSGKQVYDLLSIEYDLDKLEEYFFNNPKRKQFFVDIDITKQQQAYQNELKQIDNSKNQAEKYVKINKWKDNNKYVKYIASFN